MVSTLLDLAADLHSGSASAKEAGKRRLTTRTGAEDAIFADTPGISEWTTKHEVDPWAETLRWA